MSIKPTHKRIFYMRLLLNYILLVILIPNMAVSQNKYPVWGTVSLGRVRLDISQPGTSFGSNSNPIFLVPLDTAGNVSFTGVINNVRVIGRFSPYSCRADSMTAVDPADNAEHFRGYSRYYLASKSATWVYYYDNGGNYHEEYANGQLLRRDSLHGRFAFGNRQISIVDSMARIRSIIDLYLRKGVKEEY